MTTTADDVWKLLAELIEAQKETDRLSKSKIKRHKDKFDNPNNIGVYFSANDRVYN